MRFSTLPLLATLYLVACSDPRCRPDEIKVGTICYHQEKAGDSGRNDVEADETAKTPEEGGLGADARVASDFDSGSSADASDVSEIDRETGTAPSIDLTSGDSGSSPSAVVDAAPPCVAPTEKCYAGDGDCKGVGIWVCDEAAGNSALRCTAVEKERTCGTSCAAIPPNEDCSTPGDDNCNGTANEGCAPPARVISLSAGGQSTCAVLSTGTTLCWGRNASGQVGDGFTLDRNRPTAVSGLTGATQVSVGGIHACALLNDGTVWCWGDNYYGQLGNNTTTSSLVPVQVQGLNNVVQVTAGTDKTCALVATGTVSCWGARVSNTGGNALTPVPFAALARVSEIALSWAAPASGGCARLSTGVVRCFDQDNNLTDVSLAARAVSVDVGNTFACAVLSSGAVQCWNRGGSDTQSAITGAASVSGAVAVGSGDDFSCVQLNTGGVNCWGDNPFGQLGTGKGGAGGVIPGLDTKFFAVGEAHACAITKAGAISCWGYDFFGQLGDGAEIHTNTSNQFSPVAVTGIP